MILVLAFLFILVCYKWGDWRNWQSYYSTVLFFIIGDFIYLYIFSEKPLWQYTTKLFSGTITTLIVALIIYPSTVLLFIPSYLNSGKIKKVIYISIWVIFFSAIEYIALKFNYIKYFNGWCFSWSVLFDCVLFPLLLIHQKKPYIAWFLSFIFCMIIVFLFKIPAKY